MSLVLESESLQLYSSPQLMLNSDDSFQITYCLLSVTPGAARSGSKRAARSRKCCEGSNYFSQRSNQCTACPAGQPNLNGYYCEKNSNAMMVQQ